VPRNDPWRPLGVSLALGAAYDAAFGVAILIALRPAAALLGLDVPADPTYLRLNGVFLLMLAAMYAAAARAPLRYAAVVGTAIVGRTAGCALFAWVHAGGGPATFLGLAIGDLAFAVAHLALWRRARRLAPLQVIETEGP